MEWYDTGIEAGATSPQQTTVDGVPILLVPLDGRWLAVDDRCSHAGCAFSDDGEIDGAVAVCNCHGAEFDISSGAVLAGPATTPLSTYRTRCVSGRLEVER